MTFRLKIKRRETLRNNLLNLIFIKKLEVSDETSARNKILLKVARELIERRLKNIV